MHRTNALPAGVTCYRQLGPFDEESLPAGLLREHRLKQDVWGVLTMLDGTIGFRWDDAEGGKVELAAPASMVIPPTVPHHLHVSGPFALTIEFHRRP
jgi:tellurite resistance-related uncharacterized protein